MRKRIFIIAAASMLMFGSSCTENDNTKNFGGTEEITLNENESLIGITWKETNMWLLTVDTTTGIKYFRERSSWGIWEGAIVINPAPVKTTPKSPGNIINPPEPK